MFYKPTPQKSFGANGSHWPSIIPTPFLYDSEIKNIVKVACSWTAIEAAVKKLTDVQIDEGALILVAQGKLDGKGSSSGSSACLENLGKTSWKARLTIAPEKGYGSVTDTRGWKFVNCSNICIAGFDVDSINFRGCKNSALAWISYKDWWGGYGEVGQTIENNEFVEIVRAKSTVKTGDASDFYTAGGVIKNWHFVGCYLSSTFRPANSSSHADVLQFAKTSNGISYSNFFFEDCAIFSANNCAIQTGNADGINLEHCAIISSSKSLSRYPRLSGADQGGVNAAFNGSGKNFKIKNSYVFGKASLNDKDSSKPWVLVENTKVDQEYSGLNIPQVGSWTYKSDLNSTFDLDKESPFPTEAYLKNIWSGNPIVLPPDEPPVDPPVEPPVVLPNGSHYAYTLITTVSAGVASEGLVEYKFSVKPHAGNIDCVVGLCADTPNGYSDMAAIVQFFTDGGIHIRDGSSYSPILAPYVAGTTYNFTVNVNTETKKYSVIMDGNPLAVAFSFRTEQAGVSKLPFLSFVSTENASATISGISSKLIGDVPPVDPPPVDPPVDPPTEKVKVIVITEVSTDLENWNKISESEIEVGKNTVFTRTTLKKA